MELKTRNSKLFWT